MRLKKKYNLKGIYIVNNAKNDFKKIMEYFIIEEIKKIKKTDDKKSSV